jgi:hypothetical protein
MSAPTTDRLFGPQAIFPGVPTGRICHGGWFDSSTIAVRFLLFHSLFHVPLTIVANATNRLDLLFRFDIRRNNG